MYLIILGTLGVGTTGRVVCDDEDDMMDNNNTTKNKIK